MAMSSSSDSSQPTSRAANKSMPTRRIVASSPGIISPKVIKHIAPWKSLRIGQGPSSQVVWFLIKVAALEGVRRFFRPRWPFVWQAIQAFQVLCYPPFKWIQRWGPLRMLVHGAQKLSRPLLFLSIATVFSDHSEKCEDKLNTEEDSQMDSESADEQPTSTVRLVKYDVGELSKHFWNSYSNNEENPEPVNVAADNWLIQLEVELEKNGITLPERITQDDLQRFYTAANGDFSCLLSSVKKTIRWRETFNILSAKELEQWSHFVFWHGLDMMLRPCLMIRLGYACSILLPQDRPRFAQAVVSQIEFGILHLTNKEDARITVLLDCEGLSPLRFPMNMLKSCSNLVQDHFPNRLAALFLIRLPPVVRVLMQTFIQVLKPTTRQKLRVEGQGYLKALSEYLETVPAVLGGNCRCSKCQTIQIRNEPEENEEEASIYELHEDNSDGEAALDTFPVTEPPSNDSCEKVLRTAIVAFLMLWIFIAILAGMYDREPTSLRP